MIRRHVQTGKLRPLSISSVISDFELAEVGDLGVFQIFKNLVITVGVYKDWLGHINPSEIS